MEVNITEKNFRELFEELGNYAERYENGKKIIVYTLKRNIDNKFSLSYHLNFPTKNVQFNFWFQKISYLNSKENISVSIYNRNERFEKNRLKNILTTSSLDEINKKLDELFLEYE